MFFVDVISNSDIKIALYRDKQKNMMVKKKL